VDCDEEDNVFYQRTTDRRAAKLPYRAVNHTEHVLERSLGIVAEVRRPTADTQNVAHETGRKPNRSPGLNFGYRRQAGFTPYPHTPARFTLRDCSLLLA
jgi:hypothetical protein